MNISQTHKEGNILDADEKGGINVCFVLGLEIFRLIASRVANESQINEHNYRVAKPYYYTCRRITRERDLR